jgi:hypothetical protein
MMSTIKEPLGLLLTEKHFEKLIIPPPYLTLARM